MNQVDIFGETHSPEPEPPTYMRRDASGVQSRLFEPQMEGQLTLEMQTPPLRTAPHATTGSENTSDG